MLKNSEPGEEKKNEDSYRKANKQVKRIIYKAKDDYRQEFVEELKGRKRRETYLVWSRGWPVGIRMW